jgi:hypothetical protein
MSCPELRFVACGRGRERSSFQQLGWRGGEALQAVADATAIKGTPGV